MSAFRDSLSGKRVGIIGAGATGLAAAPVLCRAGALVSVYDAAQPEQLPPAVRDLSACAQLVLGEPEYPGIEEHDLVIPSPGVPSGAPVLRRLAERGVPILSEIEVAYRLSAAPIAAVTGTNGKTTTVLMAAAVLRAAGRPVRAAGNVLAGGVQLPLIQAAETAEPGDWLVAEVSSFQLEWVSRFRPRVAVVTNITADHMNRHAGFEEYRDAKARILSSQEPSDWAVLGRDDPGAASLATRSQARLWTFGLGPVDGEGCGVREIAGDPWLVRKTGPADAGGETPVMPAGELQVPGRHTWLNAMAAILIGTAAACPVECLREGLRRFPGVPDRLEPVGTVRGAQWVNNTMCTNVEAAISSIRAYREPVILIAGGRNKGLDFDPLGQVISERVKALVAIGTDGPEIAAAARRHGFGAVKQAGSMREAVETAADLASPGDVVLLAPACASFDWYRSFEARGEDFKKEVRRLMETVP